MRQRRCAKTSLFLLELMLSVLFFALCAAVCMRVFAGARSNIDRSRELTGAMAKVQSAAAAFKHSGGDMEKTAALLGGRLSGENLEVHCDFGWQNTEHPDPEGFVLRLEPREEEGGLSLCAVGAYRERDGAEIFSVLTAASGRDEP